MNIKAKTKRTFIFLLITIVIMQIGLSISSYAATPSPKASAGVSEEAEGTYYDKGDVELFDGEPEGTGNSAGEIVFMLVIVGICLFFVVEAIVSWIRKHNRT